MRRIFVEPEMLNAHEAILTGEPYHHAAQVLRLKRGDEFDILAGDSKLRSARVTAVDKRTLRAEIFAVRDLPPLPQPPISLAVALPRMNTFETIVEKGVELGVHCIQPVFTEFSFFKNPEEISGAKLGRLGRIVKAATEQTCRGDVMQILTPLPLSEWLKNLRSLNPEGDLPCLFTYEPAPTERRLSAHEQVKKLKQAKPREVWALIGSEGGFSLNEVRMLGDYGLLPTSLGAQILRADTACVVTASILKYEFEQMG